MADEGRVGQRQAAEVGRRWGAGCRRGRSRSCHQRQAGGSVYIRAKAVKASCRTSRESWTSQEEEKELRLRRTCQLRPSVVLCDEGKRRSFSLFSSYYLKFFVSGAIAAGHAPWTGKRLLARAAKL